MPESSEAAVQAQEYLATLFTVRDDAINTDSEAFDLDHSGVWQGSITWVVMRRACEGL